MKIAIVIPTHWDYLMGGSQYQAKLLIEELKTRPDMEILYIASRVAAGSRPSGYRIVSIGRRNWLNRFGYFWDAPALRRILDRERPDVIYQRVACAYTGICAGWAAEHGARMIWHVANKPDCLRAGWSVRHFLKPHKWLERRVTEKGIERAGAIVAQTNEQSRLLNENFGRPADRMIRNFHPLPVEPVKDADPLEVLWIANFKAPKRPFLFLDLAEQFRESARLRFTMIGAPFADARSQARFDRRLKAVGNVDYLGRIPQSEVNERLASAHLLVNTSVWEGFANTFIQAWFHGVPVMTIGVDPDGLLQAAGSSLGCVAASVEELAAELRALASNPDRIIAMGREARRFAGREFSMSNAAELADFIAGDFHQSADIAAAVGIQS